MKLPRKYEKELRNLPQKLPKAGTPIIWLVIEVKKGKEQVFMLALRCPKCRDFVPLDMKIVESIVRQHKFKTQGVVYVA